MVGGPLVFSILLCRVISWGCTSLNSVVRLVRAVLGLQLLSSVLHGLLLLKFVVISVRVVLRASIRTELSVGRKVLGALPVCVLV